MITLNFQFNGDNEMENYFSVLNAINVSDKVEKKNNLSYLSWAWAWGEIKKIHPNANYKIYEREDGCIYWTDGRTAWVKTGVTINDIEHIEYLPVMDYRNQSIPLEKITSFDVNKTIQRSLTKACARHGLGLYIYAGEDLPEEETQQADEFKKTATADKRATTKALKKEELPQRSEEKLKADFTTTLQHLVNIKSFDNLNNTQIDFINRLLKELKDRNFTQQYEQLSTLFTKLQNELLQDNANL